MTSIASGRFAGILRHPALLFLLLTAAGIAGNYLRFSLFQNVEFIFGSIFAMLALQVLSARLGVAAAFVISLSTWAIWNQPYSVMIFTAEAAFAGWLFSRRNVGLLLADSLYWIFIGIPLSLLLFIFVMDIPFSSAMLVTLKQGVNGIANALVAKIIFSSFSILKNSKKLQFRELLYDAMAFFLVIPMFVMLAASSRMDFAETNENIRRLLSLNSSGSARRIDIWLGNRERALAELARMATEKSPAEMQPFLEQAVRSEKNFLSVTLLNREAVIVARYPLLDENGRSAIGMSFADMPFLPELKRNLKPMLSNVVEEKTGDRNCNVLMLAPVAVKGEFGGYLAARLSLDQVTEFVEKNSLVAGMRFTLLDGNGLVIISNRPDQKSMTPFVMGDAENIGHPAPGITEWIPKLPRNTPAVERWGSSFYIMESRIGGSHGWKLVAEQPVAPFQKSLYDNYSYKIGLLLLVIFSALLMVEFASRRGVATLESLSEKTADLPSRIVAGERTVEWPDSSIAEVDAAIRIFREMAEMLAEKFDEVKKLNSSLEEKIEERTLRLRESEERYSRIFNNNSLIMSLVDLETASIIDANPAAVNFYGWTRDELLEKKFHEIAAMSFEEIELLRAAADAGHEDHFVIKTVRVDGDIRDMEVFVCPVNFGGRPLMFAVAHDITDRIVAERELIAARQAADEANLAKSRFLANMSHDIRTPMNGVIGLADLLLHTELDRKQREYVELIKVSGRNLILLVNDILDFSKIEAQRIELENIPFDLKSAVSSAFSVLSVDAREKGIHLEYSIAPDLPLLLKGDPVRLSQIIFNLVGNALKFTDEGFVRLDAALEEESQTSVRVLFSVADSGIGISPDKLKQIFEPFEQGESSTMRRFGGTGLGLAISRQLAELMGGSISVESRPGEGSVFRFTALFGKQLPGDPAASPLDNSLPKTGSADLQGGPNGALRILLADDDPTNLTVTSAILRRRGYIVDTAENGREALESLERGDYDLVLMDCMMPVMDGLETARAIRDPASSVRCRDIPIIALTANVSSEDHARCLEVGMNDCLVKPVEISLLFACIGRWAGKS